MVSIVSMQTHCALVENGYEPVAMDFVPLDLTGLTPQEAFVLGMAYCLLENRGIPLVQDHLADRPINTIDRHAESEEV